MAISLSGPRTPPLGWWSRKRVLGRQKRSAVGTATYDQRARAGDPPRAQHPDARRDEAHVVVDGVARLDVSALRVD
ncbi:MAG TPA: hypothetical protein VMN39_02640, partial [Longimicrobiaceae bacterium]|nr:hypothetical protein [Longimicrobiaceae bacterium]